MRALLRALLLSHLSLAVAKHYSSFQATRLLRTGAGEGVASD